MKAEKIILKVMSAAKMSDITGKPNYSTLLKLRDELICALKEKDATKHEAKLFKITTTTPYTIDVVEDIYNKVKSYSKTEKILKYSMGFATTPEQIMEMIDAFN